MTEKYATFMDEVIGRSMQAWKDAASEKFLSRMGDGSLKQETFRNYIVQDSLYLREYLKAYAAAMVKCRSLKDMQFFYSVLGYVNDGENATRLQYLKDFGMTDGEVEQICPQKENRAYCSFLAKTAKGGDLPEILMAVLPCMLGYRYVFENLKASAPGIMEGYYGPLAADYTSEGYAACCKAWTEYAEEKCRHLPEKRKQKLIKLFLQASLHELYFWQMAGRD